MRQTTKAEVCLDEGKNTSSGPARRATRTIGCERGWLRPNFIAVRLDETEDRAQQPRIRGMSDKIEVRGSQSGQGGGNHDPSKEHDAVGHSVVDRCGGGIRVPLCPAAHTPNTGPDDGSEPVSNGDRRFRSGATRADEL